MYKFLLYVPIVLVVTSESVFFLYTCTIAIDLAPAHVILTIPRGPHSQSRGPRPHPTLHSLPSQTQIQHPRQFLIVPREEHNRSTFSVQSYPGVNLCHQAHSLPT